MILCDICQQEINTSEGYYTANMALIPAGVLPKTFQFHAKCLEGLSKK